LKKEGLFARIWGILILGEKTTKPTGYKHFFTSFAPLEHPRTPQDGKRPSAPEREREELTSTTSWEEGVLARENETFPYVKKALKAEEHVSLPNNPERYH
jgi:hypothetical protein